MTYTYSPNEGDGTLFVKQLDGTKSYSIPVGSAPVFSDDSNIVYSIDTTNIDTKTTTSTTVPKQITSTTFDRPVSAFFTSDDSKAFILSCGAECGGTTARVSVLDVGLRAGLALPYACKGGVCCTCRAKVVEGEVKMEKNYTLEEHEIRDGFVLTCQCHPISDRVVVSYDER